MTSPTKALRDAAARMRAYAPRPLVAGVRNPMAKFTAEQVRDIRARHGRGVQIKTLRREFGVSFCTIWNVVTRRTYRDVTATPPLPTAAPASTPEPSDPA